MSSDRKQNEPFDDPDDAAVHRVCSILESVAGGFSPDSEEAIAIRDAATAYIVVRQHANLKAQYDRLVAAFDGELTNEMKDDLRRHGIDPDELDAYSA